MQALGLSGKMLNWFSSYLNRTQRVRHGGQISSEKQFHCGIPQGSCLGPTLFIFYINAVFNCIDNNAKVMMFADDCVIYKSAECCNSILICLQSGLDKYVAWGKDNNMHLNASKTKLMLVTPKPEYNLYQPLTTGGNIIHYVHTFNYLGLLLDDRLSLTPYYNLVKRKMENKIFVLSKIRKYVNNETAVLIYKQAILPLVEYAGFVLCSCSIGQKREMQTLQNNALRLCKRYYLLDRISIHRLHEECKIIGLEQRRRKQMLRLMYLHSKKADIIKQPARVTRTIEKIVFKVPSKCDVKYLNSPFYKGTMYWDNLNHEQQKADNVLQFMKLIHGLYSVYEEIW